MRDVATATQAPRSSAAGYRLFVPARPRGVTQITGPVRLPAGTSLPLSLGAPPTRPNERLMSEPVASGARPRRPSQTAPTARASGLRDPDAQVLTKALHVPAGPTGSPERRPSGRRVHLSRHQRKTFTGRTVHGRGHRPSADQRETEPPAPASAGRGLGADTVGKKSSASTCRPGLVHARRGHSFSLRTLSPTKTPGFPFDKARFSSFNLSFWTPLEGMLSIRQIQQGPDVMGKGRSF